MQLVFGIVGYSGSGKTTLIERLLAEFVQRGLTVNAIKHSHHRLALEPADKDSARLRAAGATEVLASSPGCFSIVHELRGVAEPTLAEQLSRLAPADLTLVEGFKHESMAKIEVWRAALGRPPLALNDMAVLALASADATPLALPVLDLNQPSAIADFILQRAKPC